MTSSITPLQYMQRLNNSWQLLRQARILIPAKSHKGWDSVLLATEETGRLDSQSTPSRDAEDVIGIPLVSSPAPPDEPQAR